MTGFDLIVRLFALVLGFSIAEDLGGFARTLRVKLGLTHVPAEATHVGLLVPLLGLLVVMDQMSFWLAFYVLQANIPLSFATMLTVLFLVGGFYLVSTLVFPAHPERWPEFDEHYFRVKSAVIGGLLAVYLALIAFGTFVVVEDGEAALAQTGRPNPAGTAASFALLFLLVALLLARGRRTNLVLLVLANVALLVEAFSLSR